MWCDCVGGGRRGFKRIDKDLWGCEVCGKPTRLVFKKLTAMRAPKDSVALISVFSRTDGINEITFACKGGERKTVLEVAGHATVLERLWAELDTTMDSLMNVASVPNADGRQVELIRTKARTQAETLAMLMSPFFNTADEIAREAKKRYDARKKGDTAYVTPGIAGEEYVPPQPSISSRTTADKSDKAPKSGQAARAARGRTGKKLPSEALPTIKQAITSGMFTLEQIAKSYGLSEVEVKEQLGLA